MEKYKKITIPFGSQTGNAEWIASHIAHQATTRGYSASTLTLDDFAALSDKRLDHLLVFVTSTTGDGDPPDNSTKFWRWFRRAKKTEVEEYAGRHYALLGLGDTNYSNFCNSAKRLDRKLVDLGSIPICPKGMADDGTGLEEVVEPWIDNLFEILENFVECDQAKKAEFELKVKVGELSAKAGVLSLKSKEEKDEMAELSAKIVSNGDIAVEDENAYNPRRLDLPELVFESTTAVKGLVAVPAEFITVNTIDTTRSAIQHGIFSLIKPSEKTDQNTPTKARLSRVRCLTGPSAIDRVIQIEFDLTIGELKDTKFNPGDSIGLVCPNPDCIVLPLLKRLGLKPDQVFDILCTDQVKRVPICPESHTSVTHYEAFKYFIDITSFPKKIFFRMLAEHCKDEREKKWLLILSSSQGTATLKSFRLKHPTIADILETFPNADPPLARILEVLLKLQPRYYSLATIEPASIAFNVSEFKDGFGRPLRGLAGGWLDDLTGAVKTKDWISVKKEALVPIFAKPSTDFLLDSDVLMPEKLMIVTAGTGITPFISFLEHFMKMHDNGQSDMLPAKIWLIYGARFAGQDVLFEDYLEQVVRKLGSDRFRLDLCLSRDEKVGSFKGYVNAFIEKEANDVWDFLQASETSRIYVCGSIKMSKDLHASLVSVVNTKVADDNACTEYWKGMMETKRYLREIWG